MLCCEGVTLAYGKQTVLQNVSIDVRPGRYTALIGPNGSGKTSLISVLSGYKKADCGRALYDGRDVHRMTPRERARIFAVVQQRESVSMPYTALELVLLGLYPHKARWETLSAQDHEKTVACMARTDTLAFADKPVQSLSGGEFQRVVLARALLQAPKVLFLDEAMSELDVRARLLLQKLLRAEIEQNGLTVVAVHHDLSSASRAADEIVALKNGRVRGKGKLTESLIEDVFGVRSEIREGAGILIRDAIENYEK